MESARAQKLSFEGLALKVLQRHLLLLFSLGIVSGQYPLEESPVSGPLTGMNEAVNNIDRAVSGGNKQAEEAAAGAGHHGVKVIKRLHSTRRLCL